MKAEAVVLAKYRMERACETLEEAELLFERGKFNGTVNRAYYAAYYAAKAMLALRHLDSSRHSGVLALFGREFVKSGTIEPESGRLLHVLFDSRQEGDYKDFRVATRDEAYGAIQQSKDFVARIGSKLDQLLEE